MDKRVKAPAELLLICVIFINSLGVQLMTKSDFGISAISSVPYVFSRVFTSVSFGGWNYVFQSMLVLTLVIASRKFTPSYIVSFLVGIGFGKMVDVHSLWLCYLPALFYLKVIYFILGMLILSFGICIANSCGLPIIPTDMFPRDFSKIIDKKYKCVKTAFDLFCLISTVLLSLCFIGKIEGIGIGTVICALFTGKIVSAFQAKFEKRFIVYRAITTKRTTKHAVC